jgi:MGT family glycosyltransferase
MRAGRFLVATVDGGGTIPPMMGLARRLVQRGHTVLVLADPTVRGEALAAGCSFTPWRTAPHFDTVADQTAMLGELERRSAPRQFLRARDLVICGPAARFATDVVATARKNKVDAILAEAAVTGILIGAEATGLPTAAVMANIYIRPAPGLPQFGTGWSPARGRLGRGRDTVVAKAVHRLWNSALPTLNAAREPYGLDPITDMYELLDHCARVLVMTSPSFDFQATELPPNVRYVGPQLDDPSWGRCDDWRPAGDDPLVLVAMSSTFQSQVDALRRAGLALGSLPVRAVLTTGPAVAPEEVRAPANVRVMRSAPHREVLREASAVLTHAGHGSVLKALAAGVPLVCMPMGRDQKDNTVRVLRLGAGVQVSKNARPAAITAAVRRLIDEPAYTLAARRFAETLASESGSRHSATDEAEGLLGA